ncbi:hypothetical protein SFUMM280S_10035 [Streptomyces fumanus]
MAARRPGLASSCGISSSRLRTSRSTSLSAKAGARRASAIRPSALARREAGTSRLSRTPGWSACESRVAPQRSSSAANSSAECLSVPSEKARAMMVATPSRPAGSASSGACRSTSTATTCWPGGAAQHRQPVGERAAARGRRNAQGSARRPQAGGGTPWGPAVTSASSLGLVGGIGVGGLGRGRLVRRAPRASRDAAGLATNTAANLSRGHRSDPPPPALRPSCGSPTGRPYRHGPPSAAADRRGLPATGTLQTRPRRVPDRSTVPRAGRPPASAWRHEPPSSRRPGAASPSQGPGRTQAAPGHRPNVRPTAVRTALHRSYESRTAPAGGDPGAALPLTPRRSAVGSTTPRLVDGQPHPAEGACGRSTSTTSRSPP